MKATFSKIYVDLSSFFVGLLVILTVLTLYVFARHHFLSMRQPQRVFFADALPDSHVGVDIDVDRISVSGRQVKLGSNGLGFSMNTEQSLEVVGWAIDSIAMAPVLAVVVRTDFEEPFGTLYGISRPDVARVMCAGCENTGYAIDFDPGAIPPGIHKMWICAVRSDGKELFVSTKPIAFRVIDRPRSLSGR